MFPTINLRETGINLHRIMDKRGIAPKDIKEYLHLTSVQSVYNWCNGLNMPTIIEAVDWDAYSTDLSLEFRKSETDTNMSIQDALYEILKSNEKYKYVIYDHGTGEIADFITIQDTETELLVGLYHVKKKSGAQYNSSVGDVYEVSGQAIKSTMWFATKGKLIDKIVSRHIAGHCKVMVGDDFSKMIKELRGSSKLLRGEIFIVQPAISKSEPMPEKIQEVLAAAETYVKRAGKVNSLRILGSA